MKIFARLFGLSLPLMAVLVALPACAAGVQPNYVYEAWSMQGRTSMTAGGSTSNVALPANGNTLRVCNQGAVNAFVAFGVDNTITVTTANGSLIEPQQCHAFNLFPPGASAPATWIAGIAASSSAAIYIESGVGTPPLWTASGNSSGGGGAVTVAGGADVTEGTIGDTQATGTVVGFLKSIWSIFNTTPPATSANQATQITAEQAIQVATAALQAALGSTAPVAGAIASGSALTGNPVGSGCRAATTAPTAVTDGQAVFEECGAEGKQIVLPYTIKELMVRGTASTTGTGATTIIAAQGAGIKIYITDVECFRTDAGASLDYVVFDDSVTTPLAIPATGANNWSPKVPLVTAANAAFTFAPHAGATTEFCSAQGYAGP